MWNSYDGLASGDTLSTLVPASSRERAGTLEVELSDGHLSLCRLRSQLLLCLVGPAAPPSSSTPSSHASAQSPPLQNGSLAGSAETSATPAGSPVHQQPSASMQSAVSLSQDGRDDRVRAAALSGLRTKGKALTEWLDNELDGFTMPPGA